MSTVSSYDPWAWIFDRYWAHDLFLEPLDRLILADVPPPARILDLCCGTGHLAAPLVERGYSLTGLDVSAEALALAKGRAPGGRFIHGDARSFALDASFDLVVSTYDSLNHILDPVDLRRVFRCVRHSIEPGGAFVFDLGTEEGFRTRWTEPHAVVEDDLVVVGMGDYDPVARSAEYRITIFREDGGWSREDVLVEERYHRPDDVTRWLDDEGFVDVSIAAAEDLGMEESADRTFFRAFRDVNQHDP